MIKKKTYHVLGLMSGTSLDGLDLCYVKFNLPEFSYEILATDCIPYSHQWKSKLCSAQQLLGEELVKLNIEYGDYLGESVNQFRHKYCIDKLDFIASHGHTIFHQPENSMTLQIGSGYRIAHKTKTVTICDFRTQDVVLGGQGAPLVPIGDRMLFSDYDACINFGGFSNISFEQKQNRIAFDICPVNIVLNRLARKEGLDFDQDGNLAKKGERIDSLYNQLNQLEYYNQNPPKSLGLEWCERYVFPLLEGSNESNLDCIRTFTDHIAHQIIRIHVKHQFKRVLVTGGGSYNTFLIEELQKTDTQIVLETNELTNYKEALIFALLGVLHVEGQVNVLASVTGAKKDHCSGRIFLYS